jgi:hypothetical protein
VGLRASRRAGLSPSSATMTPCGSRNPAGSRCPAAPVRPPWASGGPSSGAGRWRSSVSPDPAPATRPS